MKEWYFIMKGKEIINHAVRAEMPDMEQLRENVISQSIKKETIKHRIWVKRFAPVFVCLVVVLVTTISFPYLNKNTDTSKTTQNGVNDKNNTLIDSAMRGLPVENFNLADMEINTVMDRIGFINFGAFFEYGANTFTIVKVTDTKIYEAEYETERINKFGEDIDIQREILPKRQMSEIKVLQNIYGDCKSETIQITQSIYESHFCLGTTNVLRKDGVYILPLSQHENGWYIMGDMDVLFELDEKGNVWSHSSFESFNKYDGKNVDYFINELQSMFSNKDFILTNSPFGGMLRGWTLADITVTGISDGSKYYSYSFTVNEILSDPKHENSAPLGTTGKIKVYKDSEEKVSLIEGTRYLICLDRYEGDIFVNNRMVAEIGNDEKITVLSAPDDHYYMGASIFTPYDGYTISDFREMVSRINSWNIENN